MDNLRTKALVSLIGFSILTLLSSCTTGTRGDSFTLESNKKYLEEKLCLGLFEVQQPLRNGSGMATSSYYMQPDGSKYYDFKDFLDAEHTRHNRYTDEFFKAYKKSLYNSEVNKLNSLDFLMMQMWDYSKIIEDENPRNYLDSLAESIGMEPYKDASSDLITKTHLAPITTVELKNIERYYAAQSNQNICWAASLETASRYKGYNFTQNNFLSALKNTCKAKLSNTATVNQIFFAASDTILGEDEKGFWIGNFPSKQKLSFDFDRLISSFLNKDYKSTLLNQKTPTAPINGFIFSALGVEFTSEPSGKNSFDGINWKVTRNGKYLREGRVKLIQSINSFISAIQKGHPVIAGRGNKGNGHTVVVVEVKYRPGGKYDEDRKLYGYNHHARVEEVGYLDPLYGEEPIYVSGDEFLSNLNFSFYLE